MKIDDTHLALVTRRLREATGFMELGLPQYALDRLDGLDAPGPFAAQVELVRGEALRKLHRYRDAAVSLKRAAAKIPAPYDKPAMLALSACYHQAGDYVGAANALASARGAGPGPSGRLRGGGPRLEPAKERATARRKHCLRASSGTHCGFATAC